MGGSVLRFALGSNALITNQYIVRKVEVISMRKDVLEKAQNIKELEVINIDKRKINFQFVI